MHFGGISIILIMLIVICFVGAELIERSFFLIPAVFAMILSLYLLWGLYRLRTPCPFCFATHAVVLLFLILTWKTP